MMAGSCSLCSEVQNCIVVHSGILQIYEQSLSEADLSKPEQLGNRVLNS